MAVVWIPAQLLKYTENREQIEAEGKTVREIIDNMEAAYPGIRERLLEGKALKPSLAVAVDGTISPAGLRTAVKPESEVNFLLSLSGG